MNTLNAGDYITSSFNGGRTSLFQCTGVTSAGKPKVRWVVSKQSWTKARAWRIHNESEFQRLSPKEARNRMEK